MQDSGSLQGTYILIPKIVDRLKQAGKSPSGG